MPDRITQAQRSWNMAQIKSVDTAIETKVRKYLFAQGFRYRKNVKDLPGTPDIYLPKYHVAIFINGCFWHHHYHCRYAHIPKTNQEFWIRKFEHNIKNDIENERKLNQMDIRVITVWECEIRDCFQYRMDELVKEIKQENI